MKIEKIDPFRQVELVGAIILAYQQTFGQAPWNEGYKCPICNLTLSLNERQTCCPDCLNKGKSVLMVKYWPTSKVLSDFYQEMSKPDSLCLVAKGDEEILGFSWGYQISINPEIDAHLEAPGLHKLVSGNYFYLDEVAVLPQYQGKGIGRNLIKQLFENQPYKRIILRTLKESQMSNLIISMAGEIILPISRDRVIMSVFY
ncbi:MAG: GNAT family N-acetyltransferase [Candidatus Falkowbacteria bacterium]|nr:GNAT family N-acetyltransferase [Candidatus Falkowbacteria bacterium]